MTRREKERKNKKREGDINIDYDHIDVADIMDQIKRKIAKESKEPSKGEIPEEEYYPSPVPRRPEMEEPAPGMKGKTKRVLLKIMKPVSPLIKLLVLPVHEQIMETDRKLHQTNIRLDDLNAKVDHEFSRFNAAINNVGVRLNQVNEEVNNELSRLNAAINNVEVRLDLVNQEVNKRVDQVSNTLNKRVGQVSETLSKRLDLAFNDLGKIMEYTRLLHNLSHNIVVELSKLKIEEENLKSKTQIIEKDFEFLGRREKALEKEVFK